MTRIFGAPYAMPDIAAAATVMEYDRGYWWHAGNSPLWWEMKSMFLEEWYDDDGWDQTKICETWVKWNADGSHTVDEKNTERGGWWTMDMKVWWYLSHISKSDEEANIHEVWCKYTPNKIGHWQFVIGTGKTKRRRLQ